MGLLDLHAAQADTAAPNPVQALPRSFGERFEAAFSEAFAPDRYFTITGRRSEMWQRAADELKTATGQSFSNPYDSVTYEEASKPDYQPGQIVQQRQQKIIEASRLARAQGNDTLFDPENIDRYIAEEANRRRQKAASFVGTGSGVAAFLGGAAGETLTPHGLIGLAVPVTRLPGAAASAVGRTFLGNVAREAGFQASVNVGLQAVAEGLDYSTRSEIGTEQTVGEIATNIAGAAVIGAALGGGARALHLKWLGLPETVRADAPLEVKDAFRVIEAESLYSGQNRLGIDPLLHERYQGNAMDAVMRGKPVDLSDLSRTADTPLTALGTILRTTPDQVRVQGLAGLGTAMDRVRALPDREIEAFAREVSPRSFERLDRLDARVTELNTRLAALDAHTPGAADLLDPETALRLQDIERDLSAPAITRKQRQSLEDEREMIMSTVDPRERLGKQAEKAQRKERAEIEKQVAKLEEQRTEAETTAKTATGKLRTRLEARAYAPGFEWAGTLQQLERGIVQDFGVAAPDIGPAIARADLMRQARIVREVLPDGIQRAPSAEVRQELPAEPTPEIQRAFDTETQRVIEARPDLEVEIGGRTMTAREAFDDADLMMKDAQAALGCAMGAL